MKAPFRNLVVLLLPCWSLALVLLTAAPKAQTTSNVVVEVYYSPKGGCTEAIVSALGAAKESVLIQA